MPVVDRAAPLRFLRTAYQPDDWVAVFLKSYELPGVAQRVGPLSLMADPRFQAWLRWRNRLRWNVYLTVNAMRPQKRSRTRDAVRAIRHIFLEADHDGPKVIDAIARRPDLPPPSYLLHSSPDRVHVFWRVAGFPIERAEALQKQLARELGTDPAATPCTQTTRLAGFLNHKRGGCLVTMEYLNPDRVYAPADFPAPPARVTPPWKVARRHPRGPRTTRLERAERARRYLAALPPAIAGQHGDLHTYRLCCRLVRGFALSDDEALPLLAAWNARCQPPWSERELTDKLRRARRYGREPIGGLLGVDP